jgi:hypothetical protein
MQHLSSAAGARVLICCTDPSGACCVDQIPDITRAHDFDAENPRHLRAFDEEMTEMLRKALQRQALTNRHPGQHGKMSRRETELAMQGFNVSIVRNKATAGELAPVGTNRIPDTHHFIT